MTVTEQRQQIKGEAFRKIRQIYHPKAKVNYSMWIAEDGDHAEQRDRMVRTIMTEMYDKLEKLRIKARKEKESQQPKVVVKRII